MKEDKTMTELFTKKSLKLNEFSNREFLWRGWSSPSNIALVKYWGKRDIQIPENPSVSFTLSKCSSNTIVICSPKIKERPSRTFFFDGKKATEFGKKVFKLIEIVSVDFPVLSQYDLQVISENTFPHSSGIASSASSMSSLALCLCDLLQTINADFETESFFQLASKYARLGSGSACRSVFGEVVLWGQTESFSGSSNDFAVPVDGMPDMFKTFRDSVLIISSDEKSVSSSAGHSLMNDHPFKEVRYQNAKDNCQKILEQMKSNKLSDWGELVEREALELHGLMMNGRNSFILMKPNTLKVIELVRKFRQKNQLPLYFTLDAGPNVHLLYPDEFQKPVKQFIENELVTLCENGVWFDDHVGTGPSRLLQDGIDAQ